MDTLNLFANSQLFENQAKTIREELKNASQRLVAAEMLLDTMCTQFMGLMVENTKLKAQLGLEVDKIHENGETRHVANHVAQENEGFDASDVPILVKPEPTDFQEILDHTSNDMSLDGISNTLGSPTTSNAMFMQALEAFTAHASPKQVGAKRRKLVTTKKKKLDQSTSSQAGSHTCVFCPLMVFGTFEELLEHYNDLHGGMGLNQSDVDTSEWSNPDVPGPSNETMSIEGGPSAEEVMMNPNGLSDEDWKTHFSAYLGQTGEGKDLLEELNKIETNINRNQRCLLVSSLGKYMMHYCNGATPLKADRNEAIPKLFSAFPCLYNNFSPDDFVNRKNNGLFDIWCINTIAKLRRTFGAAGQFSYKKPRGGKTPQKSRLDVSKVETQLV